MQKILFAGVRFLFFSIHQGKACTILYDVEKATENIATGNNDVDWCNKEAYIQIEPRGNTVLPHLWYLLNDFAQGSINKAILCCAGTVREQELSKALKKTITLITTNKLV